MRRQYQCNPCSQELSSTPLLAHRPRRGMLLGCDIRFLVPVVARFDWKVRMWARKHGFGPGKGVRREWRLLASDRREMAEDASLPTDVGVFV